MPLLITPLAAHSAIAPQLLPSSGQGRGGSFARPTCLASANFHPTDT